MYTQQTYFTKLVRPLAIATAIAFYLFAVLNPIHAATGINQVVNFQGKVVNKTTGLNVANGNYNFTFRLYDAPTGGTLLWTENFTGGDQLTVTDGIFRAPLGSLTTFASAGVDFNTDNLYLDITFNSDTMGSRVQFSAVPYALNAEKVSGLTVTDTTGTLTIPNAKTVQFADSFTTSGAFGLTLTTSALTNVTLPTGGTLLTNTALANQTITSTQATGTVLGVSNTTGISADIIGQSITLSGAGAFDQTGLKFNLSGASGANLNDIVGTSGWNISVTGDAHLSDLQVGTGTDLPNSIAAFFGNVDSYSQINNQNLSSGTSASTDYIATADNGNDSINYIDMGINSSTYINPAYSIGGANDGYLYTNGGDLSIGTQTAGTALVFHTGGTLTENERMRIAGDGATTHNSVKTSGTVFSISDTTNGLLGPITGLNITLSGDGIQDQSGLTFNLSGASGSVVNDITGSSNLWSVTTQGIGKFASLQVGNGVVALPNSVATFFSNVDTYAQVNNQNFSSGTSASADYIATADNGTDEANYIDLGINSSGFDNPDYSLMGANDGYLFVNGGDLTIGTQGDNLDIIFHTGDTLVENERMRIDSVGAIQVTSIADSGTVHSISDATDIIADITGASINLSGLGAFDQTGLKFNLSGASGANLNDVVGTSGWKVSTTGMATFAGLSNSGNLAFTGTNPAISNTGTNTLTLNSGSTGNIQFFSSSNTLTSAGALTVAGAVDSAGLSNSGNLAFTGTNPAISNTGTNTLTLNSGSTGNIQFFSSSNTLTSAGALTVAGAISAPTSTNTINNLVINAGALSAVTGYVQDSGVFSSTLTTSNLAIFKSSTLNSDTLQFKPQIALTGATSNGILTSVDLTTGDKTWTFQDSSGMVPLGTAGNTLFFTTSASTTLTLPTSGIVCTTTDCLTSAGAVTSLNSGTGALTLNNAGTASGNSITINNAVADGSTKGISAFNATNFTASSGVINTAQDIDSASTPEFSDVTITGMTGSVISSTSIKTSIQELDESMSKEGFTGFDSWTSGTDANTYTITGGKFQIDRSGIGFIKSKKVTWSSGQQTAVLASNSTSWILIDSSGTLTATTTPSGTTFTNNIVLYEVLYDGANYDVVKENHPYAFGSAVSGYLHNEAGTVIRNGGANAARVSTGTGGSAGDREIKIVGADNLDDHGLTTAIPDSSGAGVVWNTYYADGSGHWIEYGDQSQLAMYYNSSGTATALTSGGGTDYNVYTLYISKNDIEASTPNYYAVMGNGYASSANAQTAITNGEVNFANNELASLELAQMGYAVVQNNGSGGYITSIIVAKASFNKVLVGGAAGADHGTLTGLTNDDHLQYVLLGGRQNGQLLIGGTEVSDGLTLQSTAGVGTSDFINLIVGDNGQTEALRIISNGNVGIGKVAPLAKLDIAGAATGNALVSIDETGDQALFTASASGVTKFTIDRTGATTITSASANTLSIGRQGTTNPVLNVDASTGSVVTGIQLKGAASGGGVAITTTSVSAAEALSIDSLGASALNLNNNVTGDIVMGGGSSSTGCTLANSTGLFTCTGFATPALSAATSTAISIGALSGATANRGIQIGAITAANTANNFSIDLGAITPQGTAIVASINTAGIAAGAGTATYGINLGTNISTATNDYGINIGAMGGAAGTNTGINVGALSGATTSKGIVLSTNSSATAMGIDMGILSGTTSIAVNIAAMSGATSTGLNIAGMTGATSNTGINMGGISGAGTSSYITTATNGGTGATAYQLNLGGFNQANATSHIGINMAAISGNTATANGISLGTLTGGAATTTLNQILTGALTASANASNNWQLNLGAVAGAATTTSTYGSILTGAITGSAGTASYGLNLGTNNAIASSNYGIKIGNISGAGTTNYGIDIGIISNAGTNYDIKGVNWDVLPNGTGGFSALTVNAGGTINSETAGNLGIGTATTTSLMLGNTGVTSMTFNVATAGNFVLQKNGTALSCAGGLNGGALTTDSNGYVTCSNDDSVAGDPNFFTQTNGLTYITNNTTDFAIGGNSTGSAKFVFGGMNAGTPQATFSGNLMLNQVPTTNNNAMQAWSKITGTAGTIGGSNSSVVGITASVVYNGSLYVGTTKSNQAEVYRYNGEAYGTWTRVSSATPGTIATGGTPTANIDGITSMQVYNGMLYIGTTEANAAEVYVYGGGTTWTKITNATAGTIRATGSTLRDGIASMVVHGGKLYIGISEPAGAEIYRYDGGVAWTELNQTAGTFITTNTVAVNSISSMVSYQGSLYFVAAKTGDTDFVRWVGSNVFLAMNAAGITGSFAVYNTAAGGAANITAFNSGQLAVYAGKIIITLDKSNGMEIIQWNPNEVTTNVNVFVRIGSAAGTIRTGGTATIDGAGSMTTYGGRLYVGTTEAGNGQIYRYNGNGGGYSGDWTLVSQNTPAGTLASGGTAAIDTISTLIPYNSNKLFAGVNDAASFAEGYAYSVSIDQSYALQFHAGNSQAGGEQNNNLNLGQIYFVASLSANLNNRQGNTGAFVFSHNIVTNNGSYDVAEDYPTRDDTLEPGDLVSIDQYERTFVKKSEGEYDNKLIGVYSEKPALRLSQDSTEISGGKAIPVALAGRVPVKVSTENGDIKPGDYLTSSSKPGVAMKATKAGVVIGQAMEEHIGEEIGQVITYIKSSTYNGNIAESFANLNLDSISFGKEVLDELTNSSSSDNSSIITDRLISQVEIVSPKVTVDTLILNKVSALSGNISMDLVSDGKLIIGNALNTKAITFDAFGNAKFAGEISADSIKANKIEGLEVYTNKISSLGENIASLSALFNALPATQSASSSTLVTNSPSGGALDLASLNVLNNATVAADFRVKGNALFEGILSVIDSLTANNIVINNLSTFFGDSIFKGNIFFEGRPTFNNDLAGFAVITKGQQSVYVSFEKEYKDMPVITVSINLDKKEKEEDQNNLDNSVLSNNISYIVTQRSNKGFVIKLSKQADLDLNFSWIALAIKDAKTVRNNMSSQAEHANTSVTQDVSASTKTEASGEEVLGEEVVDNSTPE